MENKAPIGIARNMAIIASILLIGLMTLLFSDLLDKQNNPNQNVSLSVDSDGNRAIRLTRNAFGHYVASGAINGTEALLLLDTGATEVSVPEALARRAGLKRGAQVPVSTAAGVSYVHRTQIKELRLGPLIQRDVPATINPHMAGDEVLLGMSFLRHLTFTQQGDTLILDVP
jgi:aspartyl protease family protein